MTSSLALSEIHRVGEADSDRPQGAAEARGTRLYKIDPLADPRWTDLVGRHGRSSLFHSVGWLRALRQTYGYRPVAFTISADGQSLQNGFVFCEVESWITGYRLVSLPFSDYCEPLCHDNDELAFFAARLEGMLKDGKWRYIELRPVKSAHEIAHFAEPFTAYTLHQLDLRPDLATIFRNFHHSSIQRKIRRAEREGLGYEEGSNESLLDRFYDLLVITRRRHRVPPQPKKWFRSLIENFRDDLKIRIASKDGRTLAGIITIRHKDAMYYKYGGSDARYNYLGAMHHVYWQAIQDAKRSGLRTFDLGRSDLDQPGLITFKSRWGSTVSELTYYRIAKSRSAVHFFEPQSGRRKRLAGKVFAKTSARVLSAMGSLLYKHIG